MVGPALQAAVTPLGDHGIILMMLPINMYTAAGWINAIMGIFNFILFLPWNFKEYKIAIKEAMRNEGKATGTLNTYSVIILILKFNYNFVYFIPFFIKPKYFLK